MTMYLSNDMKNYETFLHFFSKNRAWMHSNMELFIILLLFFCLIVSINGAVKPVCGSSSVGCFCDSGCVGASRNTFVFNLIDWLIWNELKYFCSIESFGSSFRVVENRNGFEFCEITATGTKRYLRGGGDGTPCQTVIGFCNWIIPDDNQKNVGNLCWYWIEIFQNVFFFKKKNNNTPSLVE